MMGSYNIQAAGRAWKREIDKKHKEIVDGEPSWES